MVPAMTPLVGSMLRPCGRPDALYVKATWAASVPVIGSETMSPAVLPWSPGLATPTALTIHSKFALAV